MVSPKLFESRKTSCSCCDKQLERNDVCVYENVEYCDECLKSKITIDLQKLEQKVCEAEKLVCFIYPQKSKNTLSMDDVMSGTTININL